MKKCELCNKAARTYCDSDQASLCWECDSRVHAANFLVAKHARTLLCHACQSPTPWTGCGPKFGPTVSVCEACFNGRNRNIEGDHNPESGNSDSDDEENDNHVHDDGENQVVPLSLPPSVASASSSSEESSRRRDSVLSSSFGSSDAETLVESSSFPMIHCSGSGEGKREEWYSKDEENQLGGLHDHANK